MSRTYELAFIVDPRQSDDEVQAITAKYRGMIEASGAKITAEDHWGRRKLAYTINKLNEGKYVFLYVSADGRVPWPDIERSMLQSEQVIRHLVVRTDQDIKRANRKGKVKPPAPGQLGHDKVQEIVMVVEEDDEE